MTFDFVSGEEIGTEYAWEGEGEVDVDLRGGWSIFGMRLPSSRS